MPRDEYSQNEAANLGRPSRRDEYSNEDRPEFYSRGENKLELKDSVNDNHVSNNENHPSETPDDVSKQTYVGPSETIDTPSRTIAPRPHPVTPASTTSASTSVTTAVAAGATTVAVATVSTLVGINLYFAGKCDMRRVDPSPYSISFELDLSGTNDDQVIARLDCPSLPFEDKLELQSGLNEGSFSDLVPETVYTLSVLDVTFNNHVLFEKQIATLGDFTVGAFMDSAADFDAGTFAVTLSIPERYLSEVGELSLHLFDDQAREKEYPLASTNEPQAVRLNALGDEVLFDLASSVGFDYYVSYVYAGQHFSSEKGHVAFEMPFVPVASVSLTRKEISLLVGQETTLEATIEPQNATDPTLKWSSSDEQVVSVSEGTLVALSEGEATITVSCGGLSDTCHVTVTTEAIPVTGISLDKEAAELFVGDTLALTPTIAPGNATEQTISWASSDESVATVEEGKVTALKEGEATITASCGGFEASCLITVSPKTIPVTGITLDKEAAELVVDDTLTLVATVAPEDASDKTITWTSSDESVATVEEGKVTAIAVGDTTITASCGGFNASCSIHVKAPTIPVTGISLDKEAEELTVGDDLTLTATVTPDNATDKTVTWTSSNETVATVAAGKVTALAAGDATITASCGGFNATCSIHVKAPTIPVTSVELDVEKVALIVGEQQEVSATVSPEDATDKTVTWTSSDEDVATVVDGTITAVGAGVATITATAGEVEASVSVTVYEPSSVTGFSFVSYNEDEETFTVAFTSNNDAGQFRNANLELIDSETAWSQEMGTGVVNPAIDIPLEFGVATQDIPLDEINPEETYAYSVTYYDGSKTVEFATGTVTLMQLKSYWGDDSAFMGNYFQKDGKTYAAVYLDFSDPHNAFGDLYYRYYFNGETSDQARDVALEKRPGYQTVLLDTPSFNPGDAPFLLESFVGKTEDGETVLSGEAERELSLETSDCAVYGGRLSSFDIDAANPTLEVTLCSNASDPALFPIARVTISGLRYFESFTFEIDLTKATYSAGEWRFSVDLSDCEDPEGLLATLRKDVVDVSFVYSETGASAILASNTSFSVR